MKTSIQRKNEIQNFILANKGLSNQEIADKLKENVSVIRGNVATLKSHNRYHLDSLPVFVPANVKTSKKPAKKSIEQIEAPKPVKVTKNKIEKVAPIGEFYNYNGRQKAHARHIIAKKIGGSVLNGGSILTLCADKCIIEELIHSEISKEYNYFGVEYSEDVYKKLLKHLTKSPINMNTFNGKIGYIIERAKENDFSHLILDYCGQLKTFADDIINAIQKNIVCVNGTISITLNLRICGYHLDYYNDILGLSSKTKHDNPGKFVISVIEDFLKRVCGFNYSYDAPFHYSDVKPNGKPGAKMVLLTLTRLK